MISEITNNLSNEITLFLNQVYLNYPPINQEKIKELRKLDATLAIFAKLIKIFHTEYTKRIPEMIGFCVAGEYENLGQVIHRFKSTTYNLGASRAVEIAKQIELAIHKESKNELYLKQLIILLEQECAIAHEILVSHLVD